MAATDQPISRIPKRRQELMKWNGWGYVDSMFSMKDKQSIFTGNRYAIGGGAILPLFADWVRAEMRMSLDHPESRHEQAPLHLYPPSVAPAQLVAALNEAGIDSSTDTMDRLFRSHGQTMHEIHALRHATLQRIVDLVVWPESEAQVQHLVDLCIEHQVALIPFGGGTSVSGGVQCPPVSREPRPIVSLDMSQMARVLDISAANLTARCQAGIVGQCLERQLRDAGFTCGHEPDSLEFSTLGGWVATRASGMKKNTYGNIEDLLVHVRMITCQGVLERGCQAPRISAGPDLNQLVLGSEGILGVITEVTLKIRPLPDVVRFGGLMFACLSDGVRFMRQLARERAQPTSVRLVDNEQFRFGRALKTQSGSFGWIKEGIQKAYISWWKRMDLSAVCLATLLFEGSEAEVSSRERLVYQLASQHGAINIGEENGKRGYMLTYVIAYIRDFGLDYALLAESFETSVPWHQCLSLCNCVKHRLRRECQQRGIDRVFVSCRVTQTYDAGACVYFYFAFAYHNVADPIDVYEQIEAAGRDEVIRCGGSISHHHGVGKVRRRWMTDTVSQTGMGLLRATKQFLDPDNVFSAGNLIDYSNEHSPAPQTSSKL